MKVEEKLKIWRKSILNSIKVQIREILGTRPNHLDKYYLKYKKVFSRKYRRVGKEVLFAKVNASKIIFLADYHTLSQAQKFHLGIIKYLSEKGKKINLYLEPYASSDQNILDDYINGKINEEYFLYKIKYDKSWGFEWENYKEILNFAKKNKIKVFGINLKKEASCEERDEFAASLISRKIIEEKDKIHIVIIGDLHLAPEHLPEKILKNLDKNFPYIIIYQNSETIYLKEMEKGKENNLEIVQLKPESFCVFNAPPWVKYQSFLVYLLKSKILNLEEKNLDDLASNLLSRLGKFFSKKWKTEIEIKTLDELDFLPDILNLNEAHHFFHLLQNNYSFILPDENIIYLPIPNLLSFVEELAHFIFYKEGNWKNEHIYKEKYFFHRIYYYAFGYFSSKLLFEERHTQSIKELRNLLKEKGDERAEKKLERLKTAVPYIIKIFKNLDKIEKPKKYEILLDEKLCFTISRRVGYLLGEKWFRDFRAEKINCKEILLKIPNKENAKS